MKTNEKGREKLNTNKFIERARKIHGDKYDYSKVEYINSNTKVCIICPKHGEFWQVPSSHLNGHECKRCAAEQSNLKKGNTTEKFIEKSKRIHGNKYDYSKVEYVNAHIKVCIICPEHGEFYQTPNCHLNGYGCSKCGMKSTKEKISLTQNEFIERARKIHGDKYDYSKVKYVNNRTKVCIICPKHGEFWQVPSSHLLGVGCKRCADEVVGEKNRSVDTTEWIRRAKTIHGNRYVYDKTIYKGYYEKVCIICPEHGEFWQLSYDHLQGKGCSKCSRSKMEIDIEEFLKTNNIECVSQYRPSFLKCGKRYFSLDFFLPEYNIGIECQGAQHFENCLFYGNKDLEKIQERDKLKLELCKKNGVCLIYYTNLNISEYFGELYNDKNALLNRIKGNGKKELL